MSAVSATMATSAVTSASTMGATPAVEASTSVGATSTVESAASMKPAVPAEPVTAMKSSIAAEPTSAPAVTTPVASEAAPVVAASIVTAPVAVIPGARADEHAINEPIWAVVAVRRTTIGVIIVVAISANWRWAVVSRAADANADHYSLRMRERRAKEANPEQTSNPYVTHVWTLSQSCGLPS